MGAAEGEQGAVGAPRDARVVGVAQLRDRLRLRELEHPHDGVARRREVHAIGREREVDDAATHPLEDHPRPQRRGVEEAHQLVGLLGLAGRLTAGDRDGGAIGREQHLPDAGRRAGDGLAEGEGVGVAEGPGEGERVDREEQERAVVAADEEAAVVEEAAAGADVVATEQREALAVLVEELDGAAGEQGDVAAVGGEVEVGVVDAVEGHGSDDARRRGGGEGHGS
jgi:hypothetical protein